MNFLEEVEAALRSPDGISKALDITIAHFRAETGTVHLLEQESILHLKAASSGIPEVVLNAVRTVPVGKGLAGLAVERREPVTVCNIQTDTSGDVRPGARATGMEGAIVVPIMRGAEAVGALGIANRAERTFTREETELLIEAGRRIGSGVVEG